MSLRKRALLSIIPIGLVSLILMLGALMMVHSSQAAHEGESHLIVQFSDRKIQSQVSNFPRADLITIEEADAEGMATITGAAGAVDPEEYVYLSSPETARVTRTTSLADGSFQATIFAPPGAWQSVKQGGGEVDFDALYPGAEGDASHINALPGTIVRAPISESGSGLGGVPFSNVGAIDAYGGSGDWMFSGSVITETAGMTERIVVSGTLKVTTPALTPALNLSTVEVLGEMRLRRFFDQDGNQVPVVGVFATTFSTPTGLPISRELIEPSPITGTYESGEWIWVTEYVIQTTISGTLDIPIDLAAGYYRPQLGFYFVGIPLGPVYSSLRYGAGQEPRSAYLPVLKLGDPQPPRLYWTLLSNNLSQGTRGAISRQDKGEFNLIPHIITQADTFIVPRIDDRSGEPIVYHLEPFMPLISLTDRGVVRAPVIPFKLPSGNLLVEVKRPDGDVDSIGPSSFVQPTIQGVVNRDGKVLDNGGGRIDDLYQLSTLDQSFEYSFPMDGHYVITMTGEIEDIWGNLYHGGGTYDVYVAHPIRVEPGQLPTTPYEEGDFSSAGLHLYPPVPADVEIRLLHLPNSDPAQAVEQTVSGTANRFGYFYPPSNILASQMETPGEFRIDITVVYTDTDGSLWMGSATWGNVVEGANAAIIAHGRRGLDLAGPHNNIWFTHRTLNLNIPGLHSMYPYYSGDILWGNQTDDWCGGDAIIPALTIEEAAGSEIRNIIEDRWNNFRHSNIFEGMSFIDRMSQNEMPLFSTTSDRNDLFWSADLIDQYGYAYRSSERPGVRVHETNSEDALGVGYWRFDAEFGGQAGILGDLPNDLKWEFGGAVFRTITETNPINEYGIYGSLWVLTPDNDPVGSRVMPPFQGASGDPSGGPIMVLKGEEIDIFFMPKGVQPGDILELGDLFSFSGHVGPPLNSTVAVTVTSPGGQIINFNGQANKVGWLYDPGFSFPMEEQGRWTVDVHVVHTGTTPSISNPPTTHNKGDLLGSVDGRYHFYVVDPGSPILNVLSPAAGYLQWPLDPVTQMPYTVTATTISVDLPGGLSDMQVDYTTRMPGFILDQGTFQPSGEVFEITYDPLALHQDYPNLDLMAKDSAIAGLTDPVLVTFLLSGKQDGVDVQRAGMVFFDGDYVWVPSGSGAQIYLPILRK